MYTNNEPSITNSTTPAPTNQEEWFQVVGDIDDFIFYGQTIKEASER